MVKLKEKLTLLEKSGFRFIYERDVYYNSDTLKCFSIEFIIENSIEVLKRKIKVPKRKKIAYYFNEVPPLKIKEMLDEYLIKALYKSATLVT